MDIRQHTSTMQPLNTKANLHSFSFSLILLSTDNELQNNIIHYTTIISDDEEFEGFLREDIDKMSLPMSDWSDSDESDQD